MAVRFRFAPEFEQDIAEAYARYEDQREGLGEAFLVSVDDCLDRIAQNPKIYQTVFHSFRRGLLNKFPYAVFYEFEGIAVTVHGIFHHSRDPEKWRRRLQG
ncbi:MAG: type II toxin-antitoxin system RelE/ParE family toxin [Candidatus Omnitrophica bacterium]|nr:type II toxin-antitoxin system RelE/ParE family toxin [Candidatus Omnitrophota bacterium]